MASGEASANCIKSEAPPLAEYRSATPLLPMTPENVMSVRILEDGCVLLRRPAYFKGAGLDAIRLSSDELSAFKGQLLASGLDTLEPGTVRQRHAQKSKAAKPGDVFHMSTDENIIEFDLHPRLAPARLKTLRTVRWNTLHADLLNHPDDSDLLKIAATEALFREFLAQPRPAREWRDER